MGAVLSHLSRYSSNPGLLPDNIEPFAGIARFPVAIAGPIRVNGEHAMGVFYVPMALTEGTPVASYHRGHAILDEAGPRENHCWLKRIDSGHRESCWRSSLEAREFG